ncbi:MAG: MBL fold metallo-hydrolase [Acidobacteriota bacterium]|nr:MBL fold metallo-hydrolase [Acidobacteriota bacterium]
MKLGKFTIHALSDGAFKLDGGQMFAVVPKPLWEKKLPSDPRNRVLLGLTCLLVQTETKTILVETGIGDKFDSKRVDIYGVDHSTASLPGGLKEAGVLPEDVDVVINTHLHFDHCGWNVCRDGDRLIPTFRRARYFVQRGEWEHASQPTERDRGSYVEEFFAPAEKLTEFLDGDTEILPGIRVEVLPGHTRNMQAVRIASEGEQAYFISDLVPTQAHLPYAWMMSFDLYPMETLANKKALLPQLVKQKALVVFPHDPVTPWTRIEERDGRIVAINGH